MEDTARAALVQRGRRLNYLTLGYNALEAVVSISAGLVAGSVALLGVVKLLDRFKRYRFANDANMLAAVMPAPASAHAADPVARCTSLERHIADLAAWGANSASPTLVQMNRRM